MFRGLGSRVEGLGSERKKSLAFDSLRMGDTCALKVFGGWDRETGFSFVVGGGYAMWSSM
jgi:hypothetical protein